MSWYKEAGAVIRRHFKDPEATMVALYALNKYKVMINAAQAQPAAEEIGRMFMDEFVYLPSCLFWQMHGKAVLTDMASRYWDLARTSGSLEMMGNQINAGNFQEMVRLIGQRRSYLGTVDLILRLHVPLTEYMRATDLLNKELTAIGGL